MHPGKSHRLGVGQVIHFYCPTCFRIALNNAPTGWWLGLSDLPDPRPTLNRLLVLAGNAHASAERKEITRKFNSSFSNILEQTLFVILLLTDSCCSIEVTESVALKDYARKWLSYFILMILVYTIYTSQWGKKQKQLTVHQEMLNNPSVHCCGWSRTVRPAFFFWSSGKGIPLFGFLSLPSSGVPSTAGSETWFGVTHGSELVEGGECFGTGLGWYEIFLTMPGETPPRWL